MEVVEEQSEDIYATGHSKEKPIKVSEFEYNPDSYHTPIKHTEN